MSIGHRAATGDDFYDPQDAILEADEYMANHRVTEAWRVISRLHATLTRLIDGQAERDESVRAEERERIARNIEDIPSRSVTGEPHYAGYVRDTAARIAREGA